LFSGIRTRVGVCVQGGEQQWIRHKTAIDYPKPSRIAPWLPPPPPAEHARRIVVEQGEA